MVPKLKFKGEWRSYQKRILDSLDFHLRDKKLHIVAAPGAGKTTLGIEVISRLSQPTVILAPTNTIKNQWKDRICTSFLEPEDYDIVSTDIRAPKYITVITYQALLAAFCGAKDDSEESCENIEDPDEDSIKSSKRFNMSKADDIISNLKKAGITLLCFDEAHHLRKEWWKALTYLNEELEPKQTLSLTATPPYDADLNEWKRYEELCGEIDEVISIPELVKNKDLCPHQDFIYFSNLRDNEKDLIKKYNSGLKEFTSKVFADSELLDYLAGLEYLNPTNDFLVEKVLDFPDLFVSIASLLNTNGYKISEYFLRLFNAKQSELPKFNLKYAKYFLNAFLIANREFFPGLEKKIEEYYNLAHRLGLIQNKKIVLDDSVKIQKQISKSLGKIDSIKSIVKIENNSLGKDLRMVILADFIRADDSDNSQLGVVPIWRTLKDAYSDISIGVLCGTLILIPSDKLDEFKIYLANNGLDSVSVKTEICQEDSNFVKIIAGESLKNNIVSIITELFNNGVINVLIGTQALLGEGWDAPSINSLILSSTVSSYMLSNQMRGRAIRINKNNPDKVSNIWHLASVQVPNISDITSNKFFFSSQSDDDIQDFNRACYYDIEQLRKRFEGYEAPSYFGNHEIVSGINRVFNEKSVNQEVFLKKEQAYIDLNFKVEELAKNRELTRKWWNDSLYSGYNAKQMDLKTGVDAPRLTSKTLVYQGYKQIFLSILSLYCALLYIGISHEGMFSYMFIFSTVFCLIWALLIYLKYLKTGSVASVLKQICIVLLESLYAKGLIKTSLKMVNISIHSDENEYISCSNLSAEENNLFIKSLQEFLDPIDNPRYLLVKRGQILKGQVDYFSIPSVLSSNKKDVVIFENLWRKYIGFCDTVYTRDFEGRKILLKARTNSFSSMKREKTQKLSKWQ